MMTREQLLTAKTVLGLPENASDAAVEAACQEYEYTPGSTQPTGRVWDQARSCWADEPISDGSEWVKFHEDHPGTNCR